MSNTENWGKPRKDFSGDREPTLWKIDWDKLPSYDDYEVGDSE